MDIRDCPSLAHDPKVASVSLFYRYYFGRCLSELAQLVSLPFSQGRSTRCSDTLHKFPVTIPTCYKDVYATVSFLAQLGWSVVPILDTLNFPPCSQYFFKTSCFILVVDC